MNKFFLYKQADVLRWFGIPSNIYEDRVGDFIIEEAQLQFIKSVDREVMPYPELWIWHIPLAVGMTDWLAYDTDGFLLASGTVFKEYEGLLNNLSQVDEEMGMSLGAELYKRRGDYIIEYYPYEFSILPKLSAANPLTSFILDNN